MGGAPGGSGLPLRGAAPSVQLRRLVRRRPGCGVRGGGGGGGPGLREAGERHAGRDACRCGEGAGRGRGSVLWGFASGTRAPQGLCLWFSLPLPWGADVRRSGRLLSLFTPPPPQFLFFHFLRVRSAGAYAEPHRNRYF